MVKVEDYDAFYNFIRILKFIIKRNLLIITYLKNHIYTKMNNLKRKSYYKKKYKKFDIVKVNPVDFIKKIPNKQVMR